MQAVSSAVIADFVGVNTHIDFGSPSVYHSDAAVIRDLGYLGVRHVRDCPGNDADLTRWKTIADATGVKYLAFIGETSMGGAASQLARFAPLQQQGILVGVEGPNEWDDAFPASQGVSLPQAVGFLRDQVLPLGRSLGLPVVNISFGSGWTAANNWQGDYDKVGDLSDACDFANAHTYPVVGASVAGTVDMMNRLAHLAAVSRQVMTTEVGWNGSQFPNARDVARFALFAVFDLILSSNARGYFYALYDDGSGKFGLMNTDGSPKMVGTAVRNLMSVFAGAGAASPGAVDITLSGSTANDRSLLFQRDDGQLLLALWNEKDAPHAVTVALPAAASVDLYDPLSSPDPVALAANTSAALVPVSDRPVIVRIGGVAVSSPPPVDTPPPVDVPPAPVDTPPPVDIPPPPPPLPVVIVPKFTPAPMWGPADKYYVGTGTIHLAGLAVSDQYADGHAGVMALNLSVDVGALAMLGADGNPVAGSGTVSIHLNAGLAQINAALATATYSPANPRPTAATLILDIWDQAGVRSKITRPIIYL